MSTPARRSIQHQAIPVFASILAHTAKCRRGKKCSYPLCRSMQAHLGRETLTFFWENEVRPFELEIEGFRDQILGSRHYSKCRDIVHDEDELLNPVRLPQQHGCFCGAIRIWMQRIAREYFPPQPLSLELQAMCAIPNDIITPFLWQCHPDTEYVVRVKYMAKRVQRWWRSHLQRRGLYRIQVCKYYKHRGWVECRKGCNCRYAHGTHDMRPKFVPSQRDLQREKAAANGPAAAVSCSNNG